ncbi:MAG TPA: HD-GYP domain-containing protein [Arenibaculum sp.]|nr:HD-GYP domain-containing protein [Arenibaculum sp.]
MPFDINTPIIACLANAERARDALYENRSVSAHEACVARLSALLADALGLGSNRVEAIGNAAAVHDIGKIALPDALLLKAGPLHAEEWAVMRTHPVIGAAILSGHEDPVLDLAASTARWHHEAFDGSGYPDGLRGDAIPLEARIVCIADVYDALRQDRPYKRGMAHGDVMDLLRHGDERITPAKFDPEILGAFLDAGRQVELAWGERGGG